MPFEADSHFALPCSQKRLFYGIGQARSAKIKVCFPYGDIGGGQKVVSVVPSDIELVFFSRQIKVN
jgi:hypothetical protein